ncbi:MULTISPECIES: hypothetical protein [unclassified Undibacterium]|uniref:hypothetical protein n=1 Tax=unclassified Undibacterium TaxID=2630295 RepID=UPI00164C7EDA|nr:MULTISPECIES: hypothetical protein [unclassified Undibacterium]MBC3878184.1 hypothetical protein [Undibacterium sp. FT79W]MBC3927188.1 hypothetical protein [Undibacterium sp. CY21W]
MSNIAKFGLRTSYDLYDKLKYDSELLLRRRKRSAEERRLEEFEAFNFFITAWHLYKDWLQGDTLNKPKYSLEKIQEANSKFIEVKDVMRDIANGSKHFELNAPAKVAVGEREISSWYSYFFGPQFSIETKSFHFLMYELVGVIMDYFRWIFDDSELVVFPSKLIEKLEKAREVRTARKKTQGSI